MISWIVIVIHPSMSSSNLQTITSLYKWIGNASIHVMLLLIFMGNILYILSRIPNHHPLCNCLMRLCYCMNRILNNNEFISMKRMRILGELRVLLLATCIIIIPTNRRAIIICVSLWYSRKRNILK